MVYGTWYMAHGIGSGDNRTLVSHALVAEGAHFGRDQRCDLPSVHEKLADELLRQSLGSRFGV